MDLVTTSAALAVAVALCAVSILLDRRPYVPGRPWRFPARLVMALSLLAILVLGAHMVTLLTGRPFTGRSGF